MTQSMKAVVQDRYGSADVLEFRDVPRPVPGAGEVLVKVRAAAVNALDWHYMRGDPMLARASLGLRAPKPAIRGRDLAGVIEAVGPDVTGLAPGDEVYGEANGTFAEYACTRSVRVAPKPANLTFEQAAAMPVAANTALMGLRDVGKVRPGHRVLINGASGGVGTYAIQLAKAYGAEVTGVCRTRNVELVRSLGADHVVDYTASDFVAAGKRYDVVFDLVGNRSLAEYRQVVEPGGMLVISGGGVFEGGSLVGPMGMMIKSKLLGRFYPYRMAVLTVGYAEGNLATLTELAEAGSITPSVERTYALADAAEAIRHLEQEHARSKIVVTV